MLSLLAPVSVHAQSAGGCQFILGFKTLHDLDVNDIGDCTENQAFAPNGDAQQHTTKGLMAWRKADNWTAFTNGYMTWINGPNGLVNRLNTDRFPWEAAIGIDSFNGFFFCDHAEFVGLGGGQSVVAVFNQSIASLAASNLNTRDPQALLAVSRDEFMAQLAPPLAPGPAGAPTASYAKVSITAPLKGDPSALKSIGLSADGNTLILLYAQGPMVLHRFDFNNLAASAGIVFGSC